MNLERTNLAELSPEVVPSSIEVVTADLSYLSLARAVPQLNGRVKLSPQADLVALVKPQFELGLPTAPTGAGQLADAVVAAREGIEQAGWIAMGTEQSPQRGARGSIEFFLHAHRHD